MSLLRIRPIALCVFWHQGKILVAEGYDTVRLQNYGRPVGGGIEFGETSAQAMAREVREEIKAEVTGLTLLGSLDNIFTHLDQHRHELVQVYNGRLVDRSLYELESIAGTESDGSGFRAVWRRIEAFSPAYPLYPTGLLELLHQRRSELDAAAP